MTSSGFARSGFAVSFAVLAAAACGQLNTKGSLADPGGAAAKTLGCIQGMVVDGLTGKTLNLSNFDGGKGLGLRVLVGAATLAPDAATDTSLAAADLGGHYTVCNIPLDEAYPVVISVPGYARVEGDVLVASTVASRSDQANQDIEKLVPVQTVNVRLYPVGAQTSDLTFVVTNGGLPQKGAHVILTAPGANTLDKGAPKPGAQFIDADLFLVPHNISGAPLAADTDEKGSAVFPAKDLTLGAAMEYRVIPATTDIKSTIATGSIHVGLLSTTEVQHPYLVYVDLKNPLPELAPVSSNLDTNDFVTTGELVIYYNREIEQVAGTKDDVSAKLINANGAELKPDVPGNGQSDSVNVEISGNMLRLTPNWNAVPDPTTEGGLVITYTGVQIRPKSSPGTADAKTPPLPPVKIFGGVTPPQIPTSLGVPADSGNAQTASANSDLGQPVAVRVLDQFGKPFKQPYAVTFTVTSGGGTVRATDSSAGNGYGTFQATTDGAGMAKTMWRLGSVNGTQTLTVTAANMKPLVYTASAAPLVHTLLVTRGSGQSATGGTDLADPVEVQVVDQNGAPFRSPVSITFSADTALDGTVRKVDAAGAGSTSLDVTTNSEGKAAVIWTLGTRTGTQRLDVHGATFTQSFSATATQGLRAITKSAGDGATPAPNSDTTLTVQLADQEGKGVAGRSVAFELAAGAGGLRAPGTAGTGGATIQVVSDGFGQATAVLHLVNNSAGTPFQVRATVAGLPSTTFSGTIKAIAAALEKSGDGQTATLGAVLPSPLVVQLKDQDGRSLGQAGVEIVFVVTPSTTVAGALSASAPTVDSGTSVSVFTDGNGKASVYFKLTQGVAPATYEVSATATPSAATANPVPVQKFTGPIH